MLYERSAVVIYDSNNVVIGWMASYKEADDFCNKYHSYTWDYKKKNIDMDKLRQLTIHYNPEQDAKSVQDANSEQ